MSNDESRLSSGKVLQKHSKCQITFIASWSRFVLLYFRGTISFRPAGEWSLDEKTGIPNAKKTDENIVRVTAV